MAILLDSFSETQTTSYTSTSTTTTSYAHSFVAPVTTKISSVKFYLRKAGSPTGNCYAKLYAHTGTFGSSGKPTGSSLATSAGVDATSIQLTANLFEFTFTGENKYTLQKDTAYCLAFDFDNDSSTDVLTIGYRNSSGHTGNMSGFSSGNWAVLGSGNYDIPFYLYGDDTTLLSQQEALNRKAGPSGLSRQQVLNILAGTTGLSLQDAWNVYAGTTGKSIQECANIKAGTTGLSTQEACNLI